MPTDEAGAAATLGFRPLAPLTTRAHHPREWTWGGRETPALPRWPDTPPLHPPRQVITIVVVVVVIIIIIIVVGVSACLRASALRRPSPTPGDAPRGDDDAPTRRRARPWRPLSPLGTAAARIVIVVVVVVVVDWRQGRGERPGEGPAAARPLGKGTHYTWEVAATATTDTSPQHQHHPICCVVVSRGLSVYCDITLNLFLFC